MKVIKLARELRKVSNNCRGLAFVPTMGALHRGHASLIDLAQAHGKTTLVSIFVNPTQFFDKQDLQRYPRTLCADLDLLRSKGVDLVFAPDNNELYRDDCQTEVINEKLGSQLCGKDRPCHFRGVLTIVLKLVNLCQPRYLVLGKKDYQQLFLIKKMLEDFCLDIEVIAAKTVREEDGLAISSRNRFLNDEQRRQASTIYRALLETRQIACDRPDPRIVDDCKKQIDDQSLLEVEYLELRDQETLEPTTEFGNTVLLGAVRVGDYRLIDNIEFYSGLGYYLND